MTFRILTDDTKKVINQSNVRSEGLPLEYNLHLDPLCGESKQFIKSKSEKMQLYKLDKSQSTSIEGDKLKQSESKTDSMPLIELVNLVLHSFFLGTEDGEIKLRTQIVEAIQDHDKATKSNPEHIKFRCSVNEDQYEETMSYNKILQCIEKDTEIVWRFKRISTHEGSLGRTYPQCK